jgi:hypothetical protein
MKTAATPRLIQSSAQSHTFYLFSHAFRALQRLAPAIGDGVDDPVSLLLTDNEFLLF